MRHARLYTPIDDSLAVPLPAASALRRAREPSSPRERADVETSSDRYARRFRGAVGRAFLERQQELLLDLIRDLPRGASVLDVGGGHAQLVAALLSRELRVTVLGSEPVCARRLAPWRERREVSFVAGDLLRLPVADGAYDAVVSIRLLGHVAEWPRLLAELCRVARRAVVVDFASTRSLNVLAGRLFRAKIAIEGDTRPFAVFDPRCVTGCLATQGFTASAAAAQYVLPMAFYRLCRSRRLMESIERAASLAGVRRSFGSPVLLRADRVATTGS